MVLQNINPLLTLISGIVIYILIRGCGALIILKFEDKIAQQWRFSSYTIIGLFIWMTAIDIFSMVGIIYTRIIILFLIIMVFITFYMIFFKKHDLGFNFAFTCLKRQPKITLTLLIIVFCLIILLAAAPSSKADELYYHMLVPKNLAIDHSLIYYSRPYESTAYVQMSYQIMCVIFFILGIYDGGNVLSACFAIELIIFLLSFLKRNSPSWMSILLTQIICCPFAVIWFITSSPHSLGFLSSAFVAAGLLSLDKSSNINGYYIAILSAFSSAILLSTKSTFAPFIFVSLIILIKYLFSKKKKLAILIILVPFIFLVLPLLIWTWYFSGSPLGAILAGKFGPSIYNINDMKNEFQEIISLNKTTLSKLIYYYLPSYSPIFWLSLISPFIFIKYDKKKFYLSLFMIVIQLLFIVTMLFFDIRFLGAISLAITAISLSRLINHKFVINYNKFMFVTVIIITLPYFLSQIYYSYPFIKVSISVDSVESFKQKYIPFYNDFTNLSHLIPTDAKIIWCGPIRLNQASAPWKFYDLKATELNKLISPVYFFAVGKECDIEVKGWKKEKLIYQNNSAITETYRYPNKLPKIDKLSVYELQPIIKKWKKIPTN